MSYLNKCSEQTDLFLKKLKPSRNIIVFIVSENCYVAYTLNDIREIMSCEKKHYIEGLEKLETFFYLPNGIRVDSSLSNCFENKVNTMKLIESKNKFYLGFETNKQIYSYYSVEAVLRQAINSDEDSTFDLDLQEETLTDSDVEIDTVQLQIQRDERKVREIIQLERKQEILESNNYFNEEEYYTDYDNDEEEIKTRFETIDFGNGITCVLDYKNDLKHTETWFLNGLKNREGDLPSKIEFHKNGNKFIESWHINDLLHRADDKPAYIGYLQSGIKQVEVWYLDGKQQRMDDKPSSVHYYENKNIQYELWGSGLDHHRDNDMPAWIGYYNDGKKQFEEWFTDGKMNRNNDRPQEVRFYRNGNKKEETWRINNELKRNNNLCHYISYYENGNKATEQWWGKPGFERFHVCTFYNEQGKYTSETYSYFRRRNVL